MPLVMRSLKIWGGGMVGLVGGFAVVLLLLRGLVPRDGTRVTSETAVLVLVVVTVPVIVGPVLGAYLAARLTRLSPARHVGPLSAPGLADGSLSRRGDTYGDRTGMALLLGGVAVDDEAVWELAQLVKQPLGQKLETALRLRSSIVGVTPDDREAILQALENAPDSLRGVRELLLTDESWRQCQASLDREARRSLTFDPQTASLSEGCAGCVTPSPGKGIASSEFEEASDRRPAA